MKKLCGFALALALGIGAIVWFTVARFDAQALRKHVASSLTTGTGRAWMVGGPARLVPGLRPMVEFAGVRSPNAGWAARADFIRIERLRFELDWWGVFSGNPRVSQVFLDDVTVNLETDGDGGNNWSAPPAARTAPARAWRIPPDLERIRIEHTLVRFRSAWADAETTYPVTSLRLELDGAAAPLTLAFDARVRGQPLSGSGQLGSPAAMFGGEAFKIAITGRYSGRESNAEIVVDGRLDRLAGLEGLELTFTLKADSLNDVGAISGFALPRDTPVAITAVAVNEGDGPRLRDYVLRIGQAILRPQP